MGLFDSGDAIALGDGSVNKMPRLEHVDDLVEAGVPCSATRELGNDMAGVGDLEVTMNIMGGGKSGCVYHPLIVKKCMQKDAQ